jgi:hypothetical protein
MSGLMRIISKSLQVGKIFTPRSYQKYSQAIVLGPRLPASRATLIENADLFQGVDATELVTFDAGRLGTPAVPARRCL